MVTVNRNLTRFVERVIEPTLEAKGVAFKTLYGGRRGFATILRELTGASVAGRDALGHISTATTEAYYEKAVPEAVLKGMRLLEEKVIEVSGSSRCAARSQLTGLHPSLPRIE